MRGLVVPAARRAGWCRTTAVLAVLAVLALVPAVVRAISASGPAGPSAGLTVGLGALAVVVTALVTRALRAALDVAGVVPPGAVRRTGSAGPGRLPRQCDPDAAGRPRPRATGGAARPSA